MNLTWFYERFKDELGIDFTIEDLIKCLKTLPAFQLFDVICEVGLGFIEDAVGYAAQCMIEIRDEEQALERIIMQKGCDL